MPRALRYYVPDTGSDLLPNAIWKEVARLQHWYNSEFIWSCDRIGLKRYILFPNYDHIPDMPYHIARYHFRKRLLAKKIELQDELAAVRAIEEEGLFTVRWGGVRDDSVASGITHVADNEFNAYLLCEFLLKCSTLSPEAEFYVEDEGRFILTKKAMFKNGEVIVKPEDAWPNLGNRPVPIEPPQVFAVVNPAKYDEHPNFTQTIDDFEDLDEEAQIAQVRGYGQLGFTNNYETAWGDNDGLNLQQRVRKIVVG